MALAKGSKPFWYVVIGGIIIVLYGVIPTTNGLKIFDLFDDKVKF